MPQADEIREAIKQLDAFPSEALTNKADAEGDTALESGRTLQETIDLTEELIETTRNLLKDGRIAALPKQLAAPIKAALVAIKDQSTQLEAGSGSPQNMENQVEALHTRLWTPGLLHHLEELPGLHAKNRKLESLKRKGRRINKELEGGLPLVEDLRTAVKETEGERTRAAENAAKAVAKREEAEQAASDAASHSAAAETTLTRTTKLEAEVKQLREASQNSHDEIGALKEKVKLFFDDIDSNEERLNDLFARSTQQLDNHETRTDDLVGRNENLQEEIELQLQKATGASLFHAFHARREAISIAKWVWAIFSVGTLLSSVWWGVYLSDSAAGSPDAVFWVKLGATLPLLAVVVFCLSQYGRERRAEEEYAFKSALSLSLIPYKELVEGVESSDLSSEYAKFLVGTIGQIYAAPFTAKDLKQSDNVVTLNAVETLTKMMDKGVNR